MDLKGDSDSINAMVLAAKSGEWETVWKILDGKPHIVNCIPKDRAWSALHQAVYLDNVVAVQKLLNYPDCDSEIRTKQDRDGAHGPGKKPIDLAKSQQIKYILLNIPGDLMVSLELEKPTFLPVSEFGKPLGSCIYLTLACCKGFLIPHDCNFDEIKISTLSQVMKSIFGYINYGNNWIIAKNNVSLTLQQYSQQLGNKLLTGDKDKGFEGIELLPDSKENFIIRTIQLYTGERRILYKAVNGMLRNQSIEAKKPTSLELSLSPFALLLNSILMEWRELKPCQGNTYRKCELSEEDAEKYFIGQQFVWLSFSSSSSAYTQQMETLFHYLFIIDNRYSLKWAPREVMNYSQYLNEQECLYAFGAMFRVTSFEKDTRRIYLQLIDY